MRKSFLNLNRKLNLKGFLALSACLVGGLAQASDVITNEKIIGAFTADEEVQSQTRVVRQQLRAALPNCALSVDESLRGHLFATGVSTGGPAPYRRRTYLVSRLVACSVAHGNVAQGLRRAVTAKVQVNLRRLPDGTFDEIPYRVILVDIANSDSEE